MQPINWQQFGLKKDPFDTSALIEGGDLPIEKAFVGRDQEKNFLNNLFESSNGLCLTICGAVGVGKTSLINFHKFIWKYEKTKLLFSFRREIEASGELLNKRSFLIEIIGSILREIKLLQPELLKNDLLGKLNQLVDISQTIDISIGASAFGFGADFGGSKNMIQPIQLSTTTLEGYFIELIEFIKKNKIKGRPYSGLIVHVNNFDVVLTSKEGKKNAISFFNEIRDILQIKDVYYIFLGPNNLFSDVIASQQRVRGIFHQTPLKVNPLSKTEITKALEERMEILQSEDIQQYIKPIEDDVIFRLYDLYNGDIRSIMSSIRDILGQNADKLSKTLTANEAMLLLGKERWERIENAMKLTDEQKKILKHLATADKYISQKEIAALFNLARTNVSGYYFKPLKENNIIEEKEKIGQTPYFGLTQDYIPLKWLLKAQNDLKNSLKEQHLKQLNLFS
ncbi:hypothetical protein HZA40_00795 [Candidatus Peregrinibacteria bacterium]|nr:hypothetical protein [Candidatus Peregrinibacteria bacterium]